MGSSIINIPDNRRGKKDPVRLTENQSKDLNPIAQKELGQLFEEDNNLLVFPEHLNPELKIEHICRIDENRIIYTNNIMGFIGRGNTRLRIYSRFDTEKKDYFLHYMLAKVLDINLFNLPYTSDSEQVFDFLIYLFPASLCRAMAQGLYRQYITFERNDSNIRGPIDIARHIRKNIPFTGSVAYRSREYSGDNEMTELIRHTIEYISSLPDKATILGQSEDSKRSVAEIREATPLFNPKETERIISRNLRPKVHPYYSEYEPLRKLCIQILMKEEIKYGEMEDQVYGVLFDGAWLWEEYLNKVLASPLKLSHPMASRKSGGLRLFKNDEDNLRYPDFYNSSLVLDAKYKRNNSEDEDITRFNQIAPDDLAQVISYMHIVKGSPRIGGFLFPGGEKVEVKEEELSGRGGWMLLANLPIPQVDSYDQFRREMKGNEEVLIEKLKILNNEL